MDFSFLKSNRFWALVVASFVVVAQGNFTPEAWGKGLTVLLAGFITIRSADRFSEKISGK